MSEVRLIDANGIIADLKKYYPDSALEGIDSKTLFKQILHDISNAPTVKTYCYYCGQTEHGKISENDITDFYPKIIKSTKETSFDDYLKEQLKDPEFRKEWEKAAKDMKERYCKYYEKGGAE